MIVHLTNKISPLFTACGLYVYKQGQKIGRTHATDTQQRHLGLDDTVTCKRCKYTKLYHGDNTNDIKRLLQ